MSARWLLFLATLSGCVRVSAPPVASALRPAPTAPRYQPPPDTFVRSMLLNFDSPDDVAFVDSRGVRLSADPDAPGNRVLVTRSTSIKLDSLLSGRPFPGQWDLVGLRVRGAKAGTFKVSLAGWMASSEPASFALPANQWTTLWFDLTSAKPSSTSQPAGSTTITTTAATAHSMPLTLQLAADQDVLVDDVSLAQSATQVATSTLPQTDVTFVVRRQALQWQALFRGEVVLSLAALPFVSQGYRVVEANPTRVLFATADQSRTVCIDRTGRLIEDGKTRIEPAVMKHAKAVAENASPAKVEVVGEGRVERSLPGDRNNDGFDETRGVYTVRAEGSRVTVRLTRQSATVRWPVIEIYDLPAGTLSVWLEGQVLSTATRLSDGRVVLELPIQLERPTTVQITSR